MESVDLEGYVVAGRRDRSYGDDERKCGGIIVFVKADIADHVTLMHVSDLSERLWVQGHTSNGTYLLCVWYRPPVDGEVQSMGSFESEPEAMRGNVLGTLIIGDLNVHCKRWLTYSASNSREGEIMRTVCMRSGLRQLVLPLGPSYH